MQKSREEISSKTKSGAASMFMLVLSVVVFVAALMIIMTAVRLIAGLAA